MKNLLPAFIILTSLFFGCQNNSNKTEISIQEFFPKLDTSIDKQKQDTILPIKLIQPKALKISSKAILNTQFATKNKIIQPISKFVNQIKSDTDIIVNNPKLYSKNADRLFLPTTKISSLIEKLRPPTQIFNIDSNKDTILISKSGATFVINKNSFINEFGEIPKQVQITLLEINSLSDILTTNLQTNSNDNILQTGGMFFLDAKENDKSLEIVKGKTIYVDFKSNYKDLRMQLFEGKFNSLGIVNWIEQDTLDKKLIPIPLDLLNFSQGGLECSLSKEQINLLQNSKYRNTFIATREFEERTTSILNIAACPQFEKLSQELIEIYTNNIEKDLFYSDSLAANLIYKKFKKSIDTAKKFSFDNDGWVSFFYQSFIKFKNQHLRQVINFEKYGVTQNSTIESLIQNGYSQLEALELINYYKTQQELIKYKTAQNQTQKLASYSFTLAKLGWTNVDQFIDNEKLSISDFLVQTTTNETLDFISISLVIPSYNISIFSIHQEGNNYSFTKKSDGYRKLPVGQEAYIIAISYKDNKPYFGKQKIVIKKNGIINLKINAVTEKFIKQEIASITE